MNKKVLSYLGKKDRYQYSELDKILSFYVGGNFSRFLLDNDALNIEFSSIIKRNRNSLTVSFDYYNLSLKAEFTEEGYKYIKYEVNSTVFKREISSESGSYNLGFNIIMLLENIIESLKTEPSLNKDVIPTIKPKEEYKRSNYNPTIKAILIMVVPFIIFIVMATSLLQFNDAPDAVMNTFIPFLLLPFGFIVFVVIIIAIASKKK